MRKRFNRRGKNKPWQKERKRLRKQARRLGLPTNTKWLLIVQVEGK